MTWFDKLEIDFRTGELFLSTKESIVVTVTTSIGPYGRLSRQLLGKYGVALSDEIRQLLEARPGGKLLLGEAVTVSAPHGMDFDPFRKLILAALWQHENEYTPNLIYTVYVNSLRQAFHHGMQSLAIPILKVPKRMLRESIIKVFSELNALRDSSDFSVEEIEFVSTSASDVEFLRKSVEGRLLL